MISTFATKEWLVEGWLADVRLKRRDGSDYPAAFFSRVIRNAIADVARKFSLAMCPEVVPDEGKDLTEWSPVSYYLTRLNKGPVVSIDRVKLYNGSVYLYDLPASRYLLASPIHRQMQIVPGSDGVIYSTPTLYDLGVVGAYRPSAMRVTYTAGFEAALTGTATVTAGESAVIGAGTAFPTELASGDLIMVGSEARQVLTINDDVAEVSAPWGASTTSLARRARVPDDLLEAIGLNAAIRALDQLGASLVQPGVSSESVSSDGFSESVSYQASSRGGAYVALSTGFIDQLKSTMKGLARTYAVRLVGVI